MENFKFDVDGDGIGLIVFDVPGRSMNTISGQVMDELRELIARIRTDDAIKGAIVTSGKESGFCAGFDLTAIDQLSASVSSGAASDEDLKQVFDSAFVLSKLYRELETCGKPIACAVEGLALGGGLELMLASHYRVVADNPRIKLGLPEAKVGILPGAGGTQRLTRLIGVQNAAMMILQGQEKSPQEAKALGFIDELVSPGGTIESARAWLRGKPSAEARWDAKGYRVRDSAYTPAGAMLAIGGNAMVSGQTNLNYPAQKNILSCIYEGLQLPIDAALRVEGRYFARTLMTPQARGMIRSLFVSMQAMAKGSNRPAGVPSYEIKKVAVIGAGLMGAGIAYVQARAGIETLLIDVAIENAEKGKAYSQRLVERDIGRGRLTREKGDELLARITPSTDYEGLRDVDLVIEAVFENPELKANVIGKAEGLLKPGAIFGSNTSSLPITGLARSSSRPASFIGIHFFSPVERMNLVEIIMGKETSQETVAKAIDYVLKVRKTPIVVQDSRGFYTSRCFGTYPSEGMHMLEEGISPAIIENVGRQSGMPMGPLEVADSVGTDTALKIGRAYAAAEGRDYSADPEGKTVIWLVEEKGRSGRKAGKGFYDYDEQGKPTRIWPEIASFYGVKVSECPPELKQELVKRLLFRQCVEVARCFEEGVISDPRDADVGSILAWGFAPYSGGCVSYMDLMWGIPAFVKEADRLADAYGERFRPNALLRDLAAKGESFYQRFGEAVKAAA